jgi:hypothetical protein
MCAGPGDDLYCRLSVNTQLLARVEQLMKVLFRLLHYVKVSELALCPFDSLLEIFITCTGQSPLFVL